MTFETNSVVHIIISILAALILFSIIVTTLTEMFASFFNLRGIRLRISIKKMLGDRLGDSFLKHGLITKQREFKWVFFNPFHLSKETFSFVLSDLFKGKTGSLIAVRTSIVTQATEPTKSILLSFIDHSTTLNDFTTRLENWFEEFGKRSTAQYSRDTKFIGTIIGFLLILLFNFKMTEQLKILVNGNNESQQIAIFKNELNKYSNEILNDLIIGLSYENEINFNNQSKGEIFKKVDSIQLLFSKQMKAIEYCQIKNFDHKIITEKYVKNVSSSIDQIKSSYISNAKNTYPVTTIAELNSIKKSFDEVSNPCLMMSQFDSRLTLSEGSFLILIINFLIFPMLISLGAETWFKLADKLIKIRQYK